MWSFAAWTLVLPLLAGAAWAQVIPGRGAGAAEAQPAGPQDSLGRTTPRGAVIGFLASAQSGDFDEAARYLETRLTEKKAAELAQKLFVVLDRGLPTQLNELSLRPEGSLANPLKPDRESLGKVTSGDRTIEVFLRRVNFKDAGSYWLFSRETLDAIPALYRDLSVVSTESALPQVLVTSVFAGIPLYQWLAVLVVMPGVYLLLGLPGWILRNIHGSMRRRLRGSSNDPPNRRPLVPPPVRLLVLALLVRWALSRIGLPLLARQFWSNLATVLTVVSIVWLLLLLNGWSERHLRRYLQHREQKGALSVLRSGRRVTDLLVIVAGIAATLYHFGVNASAVVGFGVGGIAVAFAARRTIENVIAGISLISDNAIRVGDFLKVGETIGTVENIGLRYTQIRTLDRTLVSISNGEMGSMTLENLSAREKFWLHPTLGLHYETTTAQLHSILDGIRYLLTQDSRVEHGSTRVRLIRFGQFSLDVEIFAYVIARDWNQFLEVQEELMFRMMDIVQEAGARIATPAQITMTPKSAVEEMLPPGVTRMPTPRRSQA